MSKIMLFVENQQVIHNFIHIFTSLFDKNVDNHQILLINLQGNPEYILQEFPYLAYFSVTLLRTILIHNRMEYAVL